MAHLIRYRDAKGGDAVHEAEGLADAIAYVERLRNEDGIEGARIYRVEEVEVAFEFKPYFRVEIGSVAPATRISLLPARPPAVAARLPPLPRLPPTSTRTRRPTTTSRPWLLSWAPQADTTADLEADRAPAHMAVESTITAERWAPAPVPAAARGRCYHERLRPPRSLRPLIGLRLASRDSADGRAHHGHQHHHHQPDPDRCEGAEPGEQQRKQHAGSHSLSDRQIDGAGRLFRRPALLRARSSFSAGVATS